MGNMADEGNVYDNDDPQNATVTDPSNIQMQDYKDVLRKGKRKYTKKTDKKRPSTGCAAVPPRSRAPPNKVPAKTNDAAYYRKYRAKIKKQREQYERENPVLQQTNKSLEDRISHMEQIVTQHHHTPAKDSEEASVLTDSIQDMAEHSLTVHSIQPMVLDSRERDMGEFLSTAVEPGISHGDLPAAARDSLEENAEASSIRPTSMQENIEETSATNDPLKELNTRLTLCCAEMEPSHSASIIPYLTRIKEDENNLKMTLEQKTSLLEDVKEEKPENFWKETLAEYKEKIDAYEDAVPSTAMEDMMKADEGVTCDCCKDYTLTDYVKTKKTV